MATLADAEAARRQHADTLAKSGVHAVGVEPGEEFHHKGFVVVAYVEAGEDVDLPKTLKVKDKRVPLVVQRAERFQPQKMGPDIL